MKSKNNSRELAFVKKLNSKKLIIATLFGLLLIFLISGFSFLQNKASFTTNRKFTEILCNNHKLNAEIAKSDKELEYGLMNRKSLAENSAMLFIFKKPSYVTFWMKDTYIPLDIVYLDENKKIVDIYENCEALNEEKLYRSSAPIKFAIETNAYWFKNHNIDTQDSCFFEIK